MGYVGEKGMRVLKKPDAYSLDVRVEGSFKCSKQRVDETLIEQPVLEEDAEFHFRDRS